MSEPQPLVGIIMGSDSDLPTMKAAIVVCHEFEVAHEVAIVSAHRTPERLVDYAQTARDRGLKVIIAGAGGAAHLPGMAASLTVLPVIGVPVTTRQLRGLDSLYSIVQMPRGIPVATVAIGNAQNAGLLALQILATERPELSERLQAYRQQLQRSVLKKQQRLDELGYQQYLDTIL
ncbi:MAG: 5-(carboxyamino)imidazole ribonucleotide mutase [Spirulinaceae cyanobacterium SM2_1_0]|nr:5-(carboxyamino)imidazole ribonucleotide mutase [Spirulinaceae cyanobacterium SM2_1_0]